MAGLPPGSLEGNLEVAVGAVTLRSHTEDTLGVCMLLSLSSSLELNDRLGCPRG